MYLKRLELQGFKSFAQKTTLEFPGGVTAIVGPNGSGKSNIIDAIRWILGEREAKNIRAEKSENLLYSGNRGKAGFAQVEITFDNKTHFFPVDFSEVTIRRRVTRDGISEYYVNDSAVRLRDVIDFFSQARLGTKGFSIINQGNSDLFIKASPVERRTMLEEVLGLRQYQIKRHEAEQKLEATAVNLDKARALVEELLPHLRVLRRQAGRYEKHAVVAAELKEYEYAYFSKKIAELEHEKKQLVPHMEKVAEAIAVKERELAVRKAELVNIEKQQPTSPASHGGSHGEYEQFKKQQADILNRRSAISKELGRLEAEMEFLLNRPKASVKEAELLSLVKSAKHSIETLLALDDVKTIKHQLQKLSHQIDDVLEGGAKETSNRQKEIEALKKEFTVELEQLEKNLTELGNLESKLASDMREFNLLFKKAFELVEAKKTEITALEAQKNRLGFDSERITLRLKDLEHQATQAGRSLKEFYEHQTVSREIGALEPGELERKMLRLRGELASIGEIDPAMLKEAQASEERYAFLEGQIADLEKASHDLKKLIFELKEKLHTEFSKALSSVNEEFNNYFRLMFNGGKAKLHLIKKEKVVDVELGEKEAGDTEAVLPAEPDPEAEAGLEIDLSIPRKNIKGLDLLSGGERSLVSIAVLFALISVSPPPFLVLDEVDAALDENNTKRFATLIKNFAGKTQFLLVTHNRATMSSADVLYGVTMGEDGVSRLLSIKLEDAEAVIEKP